MREQPKRNDARTRLFLELYWQIHDRGEADLRAANAVDFDDMLVEAAQLRRGSRPCALRTRDGRRVPGRQPCPGPTDEGSRAAQRTSYLLAVGDDWQAINRFAGADLSVMTDFASYFGPAQLDAWKRRSAARRRSPMSRADSSPGTRRRPPSRSSPRVAAAAPLSRSYEWTAARRSRVPSRRT